jgi:cell division transport system permease protein
VRNAAPGAVVDDHKKALDGLIALAHTVELVALSIVVLVALAAIATVVFITRTGLAIHAGSIELLHLIGDADGYVARQFQGQALELALRGGVIGLVLTAVTVLVIGRVAGALGSGMLPDLSLMPAQWAALAAVPFGVAVIGMATARVTVMRALRALP